MAPYINNNNNNITIVSDSTGEYSVLVLHCIKNIA